MVPSRKGERGKERGEGRDVESRWQHGHGSMGVGVKGRDTQAQVIGRSEVGGRASERNGVSEIHKGEIRNTRSGLYTYLTISFHL